jgi:hypothetical protein
MVIRSRKIKRTRTVCVDDAHRGWNNTKVPVCVYTHTAYVHYSNRAPPSLHLIVQCVDRTVSTIIRDTLSFQMISDDHIPHYHIGRSMFRSVVAITGDDILDSFEAIAAAMYTDRIVEPKTSQEDDDIGRLSVS